MRIKRFHSPLVAYSGVAGPEVLQGKVVFVKVTLGQPLHDHHIHGFNPLLVEESTPTTRGRVGGLRVLRTQGLSHLMGGDKIL